MAKLKTSMPGFENTDSSKNLSILCHVKDYCGVPIGWLMDIKTRDKRTFIGLDQATEEFNEMNGSAHGAHVYFCDKAEPPINVDTEITSNDIGPLSESDFVGYIKRLIK